MIKYAVLLLIGCLSMAHYGTGQTSFTNVPRQVQKQYKKIKRRDTSLVYLRTCSACNLPSVHEMYSLYKYKNKLVLDVYRWFKIDRNEYKCQKVFHEKEVKGALFTLKDYLLQNSKELMEENRRFDSRYDLKFSHLDSNKDSIFSITQEPSDGPYVIYKVKMGEVFFEGNHFWGAVDSYEKELPSLTNMIKQLHEIYSFKRKDLIIDR